MLSRVVHEFFEQAAAELRKHTSNPVHLVESRLGRPDHIALRFSENQMLLSSLGPKRAIKIVRKVIGNVQIPKGKTLVVKREGDKMAQIDIERIIRNIREPNKTPVEKKTLEADLVGLGEIRVYFKK